MSKIHFTYLKQNRSFTSKRDMEVQLQSHKKNLIQIVQCIQKGLIYFVLVPNLAHKTALNPINQGFCFLKKHYKKISFFNINYSIILYPKTLIMGFTATVVPFKKMKSLYCGLCSDLMGEIRISLVFVLNKICVVKYF